MIAKERKIIESWLRVSDSLDEACDRDNSFNSLCNRYDKLTMQVFDIVVDKAQADGFIGNLLDRIAKYLPGECDNKGRRL